MGKKAFFFDRDGVLNQTVLRKGPDGDYKNEWPRNNDEFRLTPNADKVVDYIKRSGHLPLVVTNQRGVYEGKITLHDYENMTRKLCISLGLERAQVFECLHQNNPIECTCRKPRPGLFLMAKELYDLDLKNSWMIGDSYNDVKAATDAGVKNIIFLRTPYLEGIRVGNEKEEDKITTEGLTITCKINNLIEIIGLI